MRAALVIVCACVIGVHAQRLTPTTPEARIAAAEEAGAAFPRVGAPKERKCTIVRRDQIVFPTTHGDPGDFNLVSGEFVAGSISFGWDTTYEQAKMPLRARQPDVGRGVRLRLVPIDPPGEPLLLDFPQLIGGGFATWPKFPTPGKWMIIATAGVNWGCFVLDRPVK